MEMFIVFVIFIPIAILINFTTKSHHESKINEKVRSLGGTIICIERRNFFTGLGPFMVVGRGRTVYRFEYAVNCKTEEGWVRFGNLFGTDWRM